MAGGVLALPSNSGRVPVLYGCGPSVRPPIIIDRRTGAIPPQLFNARSDRWKIVGGARSGHVSSVS
jgi:hypothetical protein